MPEFWGAMGTVLVVTFVGKFIIDHKDGSANFEKPGEPSPVVNKGVFIMKVNKSFFYVLIVCIILPFFQPYVDVKAETDITTTDKYYMGDEYISGHTSVKNAQIKVIDNIFGAKANENGDFKLVYNSKYLKAGSDIKLGVYNEEDALVDTEIVTIRSDRQFLVSPLTTETETITFSGNSFSRVDLVAEGKVVATSPQRTMKAPKLTPGEFLTFDFRLSTGETVRVKKMVSLSSKDIFIYPMSNLSGRTKGTVSIPNAHLYYYVDNLWDAYQQNRLIEFYADEKGNFSQDFGTAMGIVPYFYVCVMEPVFDNFIGYGEPEYLEQSITLNPITNLSEEISGRATPNQTIEITDLDTKELIGETSSDDFGYYKLAVSQLVTDDFISVKAYSKEHPERVATRKTDVQRVYINDMNDASDTITGNSSFGTSVSVEVTSPTQQSLVTTLAVTVPSKKIYGPYSITEGRDFSLKTGRLASGSKVSLTFAKNGAKATLPAMTVNKVLTPAPSKTNVAVVNNKGTADAVTFKNILAGATVKVYTTKTGGVPVKTLKATTTSAKLSIPQLGRVTGTLYVTITNPGLKESDRVAISYLGEHSDAISSKLVKVINYKGKSDVVSIRNIAASDVINVYSSKNQLLATKRGKSGTTYSYSYKQFGTKANYIYVTITKSGMLESPKTKVTFLGEPSPALKAEQVKVTNNKRKSDVVTVCKIAVSDVIQVYSSKNQLLATKKVKSGTSISLSIKQLGSKASYIYVTNTKSGMVKSPKTKISFKKEK
ncbi:hypothetical protein G6549_22880 [Bacillus sp. MM2020_1]|nr:hypothetical protein [Bacillus sp. MM2020_1]